MVRKCVSLVSWHPSYQHEVSQPYDQVYSARDWWEMTLPSHFSALDNPTLTLNFSATWANKCLLLFNLSWFFSVVVIDSFLTDSLEGLVKWKENSSDSEQMWQENVRHLACGLPWRIPWTEEPGGLQSMGSQRVGYHWATNQFLTLGLPWWRRW